MWQTVMNQNRFQKILLINPPGKLFVREDGNIFERKHCSQPIGLAYLAASLLTHGYDVEVLDTLAEGYENERYVEPFIIYGLDMEDIKQRILSVKPDVIGISVLFSNRIGEAHQIAGAVKDMLPEVKIVLGGQHPSATPMEIMKDPNINFVISCEADLSLIQLMNALNHRMPLNNIRGLYFRSSDGAIHDSMSKTPAVLNGKGWKYYSRKDAPIPQDLDELPMPAWHLFPMETYWKSAVRVGGGDIMRERFGVLISTRGCPHVCNFCTCPLLSGYKAYRQRSNENVIKEMRHLIDQFGVQEIQFMDDNFFVSKPRAKRLFKMINDEFQDSGVIFSVPTGADVNAIDEETIDLMAAANFHKVVLAIEAGDPAIQKSAIEKAVKLDRVAHLVDYIRSRGMTVHSLFMIGFPGEKATQIHRTVDLALSLDVDDFYISIATPLPGTPMYDDCVERGLLVDGFDPNNLRFSISNIKLPDMSGQELEALRRNAWLKMKSRSHRQTGSVTKGSIREFQEHSEYEKAGLKTEVSNLKNTSRN
jgi:radical SAM superfamily enzyme YgiQ (UPF0313 family)|tara:strand:- start:1282 stop:2883 length:1602 start_codon:yes stop_codon:yes gene_type:complete